MKPKDKADLLGRHFSQKLSADSNNSPEKAKKVRAEMKQRFPQGKIELKNQITIEEIQLAAKDLPKNKAAGPDQIPAEIYHHCTATHQIIRDLFTQMIENAAIPEKLRHFYIAPLDKPGKDPTKAKNKRPIALLSPLVKMLELVLVRRILPLAQEQLSEDQYAYQRARSTEVLLAGLRQRVPPEDSGHSHTLQNSGGNM